MGRWVRDRRTGGSKESLSRLRWDRLLAQWPPLRRSELLKRSSGQTAAPRQPHRAREADTPGSEGRCQRGPLGENWGELTVSPRASVFALLGRA